jgi:hypothetical protein
MNNRIEINIVVVSDIATDRKNLAGLLFMENTQRSNDDFLVEPAEVYVELDFLNFPNISKKCQNECQKHNELVMQQKKDCAKPLLFNCTKRIRKLINYESKTDIIMNKNILLTFYFLGNNYREFDNEFLKANIIIYIAKSTCQFNHKNELFSYVFNVIQNSDKKKYLLPIINNNQIYKKQLSSDFDNKVNENILPFITMSLDHHIEQSNIIHQAHEDNEKYLRECGYTTFRNELASILNSHYENMIDDNFKLEIEKIKCTMIENPSNFITGTIIMQNKITKLEKILKKDFQSKIDFLVDDFLNVITVDETFDINSLDKLSPMYKNNTNITSRILYVRKKIQENKIKLITNNFYNDQITRDIFLPSKVHLFFDELCDLELTVDDTKRLAVHICELYGKRARNLLNSNENIQLLYDSYFDDTERLKMLSMLNEVISKIPFGELKTYLIQIMLTKLMIVEKCIETKKNMLTYCKSLRHFIAENRQKKYDYLFISINDICTNLIFKVNDLEQLQYLSDNIDAIINFNPGPIIELEKFIFKIIKKNSYRDLIARDQYESDDDSDVDTYDNKSFDFTKDDYDSNDDQIDKINLVEV